MPYCAPSVNGAQCQGYSWLPSVRGAGWPAQPGISSLVRLGCKPALTSLNLTSCIAAPVSFREQCRKVFARQRVPKRPEAAGALSRAGRPLLDERPGVQLVERLLELGLGVHDDGAVPG